jgi:very-short-patch-repair endonuclease
MNEKKVVLLYTKDQKSTYEIAEHFKTYPNKIRRILIKHGVELKSKSDAQKNALKKGVSKIPTAGLKRTKEERLKISKSLQARWEKISEEDYNKHVKKAKDRWARMSDLEKKKMTSAAIQAIQKAGKEGSKLEKFLKYELSKHGFTIEIHKKNLIPNENLEIDMYFPELRAIVEIDGPSHFLPIWGEQKLQKQIKADENKTGLILSKGLAIIRVKNLSDSISLTNQENLKDRLIDILSKIEKKFPKRSERYIEIEA